MKALSSVPARLAIFFVVVVVIATAVWGWWRDGISPVDPQDQVPVLFVVNNGEGVRAIANRLSQERLIRSSTSFYVLVKYLGIEKQIQAGDFRLSRTMNAQEIAQELTHGIVDVWVTTLEGWRVEEVAGKLTKELDIPSAEFLKVAREGYMFPDTYLIPNEATAGAISETFLRTFNQKITAQMRTDVKKTGLTFEEVIVLASIVEREGRTNEDRPVIAGILLNRLRADWPLQADATLQYALGYQSVEKTWWKKYLTNEDKKIKSLFNTYEHTGLPPAPISNPGISAINAVIYSQPSSYWYYLHDEQGNIHVGKTLEDHEANIEKYL
jgi:UPF0755 protein